MRVKAFQVHQPGPGQSALFGFRFGEPRKGQTAGDFFRHADVPEKRLGLKPKPAPDIFRRAAELLKADQNVLFIQDSAQGVAAAKAAGFDVVQVLSIS